MTPFERARAYEKKYHDTLYEEHTLFTPGSWLHKPIQFVIDSFAFIRDAENVHALDVGCGVGRHSIPLAQYTGEQGKVVCVDLLESAISVLRKNAETYGISHKIIPTIADIETFPIPDNSFDYILSVSCIEHASSRDSFVRIIRDLQHGTKQDGVHCFCVITDNMWTRTETEERTEPILEINLDSSDTTRILHELYQDWHIEHIGEKQWKAPEIIDGVPTRLTSTCIQFLAIKH